MDGQTLAPLIPVTTILVKGVVKVAKVKAAIHAPSSDPQLGQRLEAIEQELGSLRQEERVLAQHKNDRLEAPKSYS